MTMSIKKKISIYWHLLHGLYVLSDALKRGKVDGEEEFLQCHLIVQTSCSSSLERAATAA